MKILVVEDDEILAHVLKKNLASQHYLVELATDGEAAWELVEAFEYDLILLDVILPKMDGISFCRRLRAKGDRTPILLLTAEDSSSHKVAGLDAGADDYAIKPFDLQELLARIRALLRRGSSLPSPVLEWGLLCLNPSNCEVTYNGKLLYLTSKEYGIVELLLRNSKRIFSQSALLDHLWSFDEPPTENTVRAHIKSLRQKLKKTGAPELIETVYGLGYRLKLEEKGGVGDKGDKEDKGELGEKLATGQQQIPAELLPLWERFKGKYSDRITALEKAIAAVSEGTFDRSLRQQADKEAHTLVGSLGSFGLLEASRLCREIERVFQVEQILSQAQVKQISELVVALRQELGTISKAEEAEEAGGSEEERSLTTSFSGDSPRTSQKQQLCLLIIDDAQLTQALIWEAKARGIQAEAVKELSTAREVLARIRPDVVLLDLCCDSKDFELLAQLATKDPPVPVVVLAAQQSFALRLEVARLGGRSFLQKPVSPDRVMDAIAQVLQQLNPAPAKLTIVDDDPQLLEFLQKLLEPWGFKLTLLSDPQQFWQVLEQSDPDLLILDVEMPQVSGIELCQVVRNDPHWSELPVLFLSARKDAETVYRVFTAGADDYVNKPIVEPELVARILNRLERSKIRHQLRKLSGTSNLKDPDKT